MDWYSCKVLSRRLSATMDVDFIDALEEALWNARDMQYGSEESIYQHGVYQYPALRLTVV